MRWYQFRADEQVIAAVYEENRGECDPLTCEYEAWAVTAYGIERIYVAKQKLEQQCRIISEDEAAQFAPGLIETLRIARPDTLRPAKASPQYLCKHGEGCLLAECSQDELWRDAQQREMVTFAKQPFPS